MLRSTLSTTTLLLRESELRIFERGNIRKVWGAPAYNGDDNTVMVTFENYVKKLNMIQVNRIYKTVRGLGYKFVTK